MSPASGPWPSAPGVSMTAGSPCSAGWPRKTPSRSPSSPVADVRVPVAVRGQRRVRVVDVECAQPLEADRLVDRIEHRATAPPGRVRRSPRRTGGTSRGRRPGAGDRRAARRSSRAPRSSGRSCRRRRRSSPSAATCRPRSARAPVRSRAACARGRPRNRRRGGSRRGRRHVAPIAHAASTVGSSVVVDFS